MTTMPVQEPAIRVQGLAKSFKDVEALRGVDFDVARGSIFALLGANGAGKTTVVNILSTLAKADAGSAGQRLRRRHGGGEGAGVHQPDRTVRGRRRNSSPGERTSFWWPGSNIEDPDTVVDGLLERFELTDAATRRVSTYSRWHAPSPGRRDEPDRKSAGDIPRRADDRVVPKERIEVWDSVKSSPHKGSTVLLTTQYLGDEAEQLADRIAILHEVGSSSTARSPSSTATYAPAKVEYVEKQPTLEDIYLATVGARSNGSSDGGDSTNGTDR